MPTIAHLQPTLRSLGGWMYRWLESSSFINPFNPLTSYHTGSALTSLLISFVHLRQNRPQQFFAESLFVILKPIISRDHHNPLDELNATSKQLQ